MAGEQGPVSVPILLKFTEEQFSTSISNMKPKVLMDTISGLQQEMRQEQENFNSLSQELDGVKDKRSQQYKQISKDLVASQGRLTLLMNRSMKCFSQQSSSTQTLDRKKPASSVSKLRANSEANLLSPSLTPFNSNSQRPRSSSFNTDIQQQQLYGKPKTVNIVSISNGPQNVSRVTTPEGTSRNFVDKNSNLTSCEPVKRNNGLISNSNSSSKTSKISVQPSQNGTKNGISLQNKNTESNSVRINNRSESFSVIRPSPNSVSQYVTVSTDISGDSEEKKTPYKIPQVSALRKAFEGGSNDTKNNIKVPNGVAVHAADGGKNKLTANGTFSKSNKETPPPHVSESKQVHTSGALPKSRQDFSAPHVTESTNGTLCKSNKETPPQGGPESKQTVKINVNVEQQSGPKSPSRKSVQFDDLKSERNKMETIENGFPISPAMKRNGPLKSSLKKTKHYSNSPSLPQGSLKDVTDSASAGKENVAVPVTSIDDVVIIENSTQKVLEKDKHTPSTKLDIKTIESKTADPSSSAAPSGDLTSGSKQQPHYCCSS